MSDGFAELVDRATAFFTELEANNTKDWFAPKKDYYTAEIKRPAELLADIMGEELARVTGAPLRGKLFRIHRDVRFSKDKSPYNAHLHLMWQPNTEGAPVWFLGAAPRYLIAGMGVMGFKGARMTQYRALVDRRGDDLANALDAAGTAIGATLSDWGGAPLKRVPKPYDPDHPHADLLRRKSLTLNADLPAGWRDTGLIPALTTTMRGMMPVWQVLSEEFG